MHMTIHVHASHHIGHEWVEKRKLKGIVLEELVELKPDLKFIAPNGTVDGDIWREWKRTHRVSSATYNILLQAPGNQHFGKRLTNEEKLKRTSKFQEKFPNVLSFFGNFLCLMSKLSPNSQYIRLQIQDSISLALWRE